MLRGNKRIQKDTTYLQLESLYLSVKVFCQDVAMLCEVSRNVAQFEVLLKLAGLDLEHITVLLKFSLQVVDMGVKVCFNSVYEYRGGQ
jgi:hypothetical protein